METARQEQHQLESDVYATRHDSRAMYELLAYHQRELNRRWPSLSGDDLLKAQGKAQMVAQLINTLTNGPGIKNN